MRTVFLPEQVDPGTSSNLEALIANNSFILIDN